MKEPHWLATAKSLKFGEKRKIRCCGKSPSMIVTHGTKGYSAHCFRSADHGGFEPHGTLSLARLEQRKLDLQEISDRSRPLMLPADAKPINKENAQACLWGLSCGITLIQQTRYGFQYSPSYQRVFLPITGAVSPKSTSDVTSYEPQNTTMPLIGWLSRALSKDGTPKYLMRTNSDAVVFKSLKADLEYTGTLDGVIVEDCLSCIRVGRFLPTVAILGTSVSTIYQTLEHFGIPEERKGRVAVWLDGDKAGRKGREAVARQVALMGHEVVRINTPKDPKKYSNADIRRLLSA